MGYLNKTSCYLMGPIEFDSDLGCKWRSDIIQFLEPLGVKTFNPLNRPDWIKSIVPYTPPNLLLNDVLKIVENNDENSIECIKAQKLVRDACCRFVNTCDFVICYLPNTKTYGTIEELARVDQLGKPIIAICPDNIPSLWIFDILNNQHVFDDFESAKTFLTNLDLGNIESLDALRWIFIEDDYVGKSI